MRTNQLATEIIVFDLGGTWFRWGIYDRLRGLTRCEREPAINHLSHPALSATDLQLALVDFITRRARELYDHTPHSTRHASISLGAPINAHDLTVLGSGPLWGPTAKPFQLHAHLQKSFPALKWHIVNDVTALLEAYVDRSISHGKTMLITASSGIGSRIYDHHDRRIPYDAVHGIQGEIGHLVCPFELDGKLINRQCECGGWNHMNAFASGRGIAQTLRELPALMSSYRSWIPDADSWLQASDEYRLSTFQMHLARGNETALNLLDALVTPLTRALASALTLDPEIHSIVITGGVAHGLGTHYREALQRTFVRDGLYQITSHDPQYLMRRLRWPEPDDFAGLRGAGIHAERMMDKQGATTAAGAPMRGKQQTWGIQGNGISN